MRLIFVRYNSGTGALHLSLLVAGVTENSEVITQPFSFITADTFNFQGRAVFRGHRTKNPLGY